MGTVTITINGNPNVGLFGLATNEYCLIGREVSEKVRDEIQKALDVPVHPLALAGTSLIGIFAAGNSNGLIVPGIILDNERRRLEELGIPYTVLETIHTGLGNLIACNDKGAIISSLFTEEEEKIIRETLKVPVTRLDIAETETPGSVMAANSRGCVIHREATEEEQVHVATSLSVEVEEGTINFANPYIRSGILANDKGMAIGGQSTGPEVNNAYQVFGYDE